MSCAGRGHAGGRHARIWNLEIVKNRSREVVEDYQRPRHDFCVLKQLVAVGGRPLIKAVLINVDVYVCEQSPACSNPILRQIVVRLGHGFRVDLQRHYGLASHFRARLEVECVSRPDQPEPDWGCPVDLGREHEDPVHFGGPDCTSDVIPQRGEDETAGSCGLVQSGRRRVSVAFCMVASRVCRVSSHLDSRCRCLAAFAGSLRLSADDVMWVGERVAVLWGNA
ncbi:hypothetical protein L1887_56351 [Cichorium endivia]|nr:hypothetical protein L1887_56351 [Cichorium endivia]